MLDNDKNVYDRMTDEELVRCAAADKLACEALLLRYAKLIFIKAAMCSASESDRDDLCQEGLMALLRAISTYDEEREAKFSTYAEVCIVNRMRTLSARAAKAPAVCESIDEFVATARELGYDIDAEEVERASDFSDELLEGIAGGGGFIDPTKAVHATC